MASIRSTLTMTLCVIAICILPLAELAVYFTARELLVAQLDATLSARAGAIVTAIEIEDGELEVDDDILAFAGFGAAAAGDFFDLTDSSGGSLSRSASLRRQTPPPAGKQQPGQALFAFGNLADGTRVRMRWETFTPATAGDDARFRSLDLWVASESLELEQTLRTLAFVLAGTGVVSLAVLVLAMRSGLSRGLRPLQHLAGSLRDLRPGQSRATLPPISTMPDELQPVVEKLDELLQRVDVSLARERRFSSHAAHELRTPLAELRAAAELSSMWPEEATPERHAEMLQIIGELEALLERLTLLARADAGGGSVEVVAVDLVQSVKVVEERCRAKAEERSVKLDVVTIPGPFQTDPVLWNAILTNLIGNAISHAPRGSHVRVAATPGHLRVSNPAPHLNADDLPLMFERFWRKEGSAGQDHHSGLGLSIVRACAEALGGECAARLDDGVLQMEVNWRDGAERQ